MLTVLKLVPLLLFPIAGLLFLKPGHFVPADPLPWMHVLSKSTLIAFWGFIGVESATAPSGSVMNPQRTIPRALIFGTLLVVVLYLTNTTAVIGLVDPHLLSQSASPHGLALNVLCGGEGGRWISALIVIVCLGALNAWCLICSQTAQMAAREGLFPAFFKKQNRFEAPFMGILVSGGMCVGVLTCLMSHSLAEQMSFVVDVSVVAYLGIYLLCAAAFLMSFWRGKIPCSRGQALMVGGGSFAFCLWPLWGAGLETVLWASLVPLVGVLFDGLWRQKRK